MLSNLYATSFPHPFVWFSTNAAGAWFLRATNRMIVCNVTNVHRLEVWKTREQPPSLVNPNEPSLNYIVYERSDPQPYIGSANGDALYLVAEGRQPLRTLDESDQRPQLHRHQ